MSYQNIHQSTEQKMIKAVEVMEDEFKGVRSGRATPALVDSIRVDYYNTPTPLKQLATISIPEPNIIIIKPYDVTSVGGIEKAILKSNLGITPVNDGKMVRLVIPPLSEERRKQMAKLLKDISERAKVAVRNIRRDANNQAEAEFKSGALPEDDKFRLKDELQKLTEKYEKKIDELISKKNKEIMEV